MLYSWSKGDLETISVLKCYICVESALFQTVKQMGNSPKLTQRITSALENNACVKCILLGQTIDSWVAAEAFIIHNIGKAIRNILTDLEGTPEMSFSGITPKILTFEYYVKNKKKNLECSEPVEKNLVNRTIFEWVTALWNMYINGKTHFRGSF